MDLLAMLKAAQTRLKAIFAGADTREENKGILTTEELEEVTTLSAEVEGLNAQIAARNALTLVDASVTAEETALNASPGSRTGQTTNVAGNGTDIEDNQNVDKDSGIYANDIASFALDMKACQDAAKNGIGMDAVNPKFKKFLNAVDKDAAKVVAQAPSNVHAVVGTDEGGFMVPADFRTFIYEVMASDEGLLGMTNPEPTNSNQVSFAADETTPWSAEGIQASWVKEAGQLTPSELVTEGRLTRLEKIAAYVTATDEILADAPRLQSRLMEKAPRNMRFKVDEAVVSGNGVGKPVGYLNSPARVVVAKEGGQAADTLVVQNISNMYSRIVPEALNGAFWLCNQDIFTQLVTMVINDRPIYTSPQTGIVNAPAGTLFGLPIRFSQHARTLGDEGDIQLVNLSQGYYSAIKASGIKFASSIHLFFDYDVMAFRWTFRVGGRPYLSAPIDPQYGANTTSHFVTLAARA